MNSDKYISEKLILRTITPVFIGTNQAIELSPYSDYIQKGDKIIIIDDKKLENVFSEKPELIDDFVNSIRSSIDKSKTLSEFDLRKFLEDNYGEVEKFQKYTLACDSDLKKTKIRRFISTAGFPFIPGSTIKGAIRTAIIYYWLTDTDNGKEKLSALISAIKLFFENQKKFEGNNKQKLELKIIKKKLDETLNEQMLFGEQKNNPYGFDARHIRISDTNKFDFKELMISKLHRVKLRDEEEVSPLPSEVLKVNVETYFNYMLVKSFVQPSLVFLNLSNVNDLFKLVNQFSQASIDYEINSFESFHNKLKNKISADKTDYSDVIKFYGSLKEIIRKSNNQYAIMRIGNGKTYFDNSIGMAIYKEDEKTFKHFREILELGKNPTSKKLVEGRFPTTRTLTESTGLPVGWVAIFPESMKGSFNSINIYASYSFNDGKNNYLRTPNYSANKQLSKLPNASKTKTYIIAEIIDDKAKPPKVKILEGDFKDHITILPGVRLEGLGLKKGSKVLVDLLKTKKGIVEKAEYKGLSEN